jgi:glycosyltransferase involved in cell wall biosynthesis
LPVVATRIPGTVNAIRDGITGTLIEPGSVPEIIHSVSRYLDSPSLRKSHGQNGRRFITECFDQRRVWGELSAIIANLANRMGIPLTDAPPLEAPLQLVDEAAPRMAHS